VVVDTKLQAQVTQEMFMDGYKIAVTAMNGKSLTLGRSNIPKVFWNGVGMISDLMLTRVRRATRSL
jgi:hypothetical protein